MDYLYLLIYFFIILSGVCVGSFLNVLIDRLPKNESIVKSRSHCDHCRHKLHFMDLLPILSFLFLNGKCRYCHSPISIQYPIVELLTGILFVFTFSNFQPGNFQLLNINIFTLLYYLFIISSLIVIFFTDFKYGIIPDKIVYSGIIISFLYLILNTNYLILSNGLSAFFVFAFFLLIFILTHGRGMGFGDVKLVFLLGLLLGFPKIMVALYTAFLLGAIIALILIIFKRKKFFGDTIPFGPFLVLGTFLAMFLGDLILKNYMAFLIW